MTDMETVLVLGNRSKTRNAFYLVDNECSLENLEWSDKYENHVGVEYL